jgi:hypothetical protein
MGQATGWQRRFLINCSAAALFLVSACASQEATKPEPAIPFADDLKKYPGLLTELGHLVEALQKNVQLPPARTQSRLLPQLPPATTYYVAFPNYGETAHQTLETLRQELKASPVLRDWWQHGELSSAGPKLEDFLGKFYEVSQYLGDEVVVSGETGGIKEPGAAKLDLLIVAEVRKPGLENVLRQMMKDLSDGSESPVRVLDPRELAQAKNGTATTQLVVLVRPDFVVANPEPGGVAGLQQVFGCEGHQFCLHAVRPALNGRISRWNFGLDGCRSAHNHRSDVDWDKARSRNDGAHWV